MSHTTNDPIIFSDFQPGAGIIGPFQRFFKKLVSGSYPLLLAAILAMIGANIFAASYHSFWHTELSISFGQILPAAGVAVAMFIPAGGKWSCQVSDHFMSSTK